MNAYAVKALLTLMAMIFNEVRRKDSNMIPITFTENGPDVHTPPRTYG